MTSNVFAHRLRRYRKEAGLSQRGAAKLLGATPTQVMEWEKGKRMPSGRLLMKLAVLYQRQFEDMYYELRQEAMREIKESRHKYGEHGTRKNAEKPP